MDISKQISANLSAWMRNTPGLETIEEVVAASGASYGTVRRIRNGETNPTAQQLEMIAKAFHRQAADLLAPVDQLEISKYSVQQPSGIYEFQRENTDPSIDEAVGLLRQMSEHGKRVALKHLQLIAEEHPIVKQTTAAM